MIIISKLPENKQLAAQLLATGAMEKQKIASVVGINRGTLWNWEKDEEFIAEVDRVKQEIRDFGINVITGKLNEAIEGLWSHILTTQDSRVKADGYKYFIDRSLGKPSSKLDIVAEAKTSEVSQDILESEFEEWESDVDEA